MKVKISKNAQNISSIDFRANEPVCPGLNVDAAFACFGSRLDTIPYIETVKDAFRSQNPKGGCLEYRAEVNGDIWKINIIPYFCSACGVIQNEVDNEGDICWDCRNRAEV